jgi:hypothetical protein
MPPDDPGTTDTNPPDNGDGGAGARLDRLEQQIGQISAAVRQLVNGNTPARQTGRGIVSDRLNTEADVAEQVKAELARARAEDAAASRDKSTGDRLAAAEAAVKALTEKPPEPPQRPIERLLYGARG